MNNIVTIIIDRRSITRVNESYIDGPVHTTQFQTFEEFVRDVEYEANKIEWSDRFELINVSFANDTKAVIIYRQLEEVK